MTWLKALYWSSRPVSWINTAYPFVVGYLVFEPHVTSLVLVGGLFFLVPYNILMYGVNDVFDYESDLRNPRKNSIEGAIVPPEYHRRWLWTAGLVCLPFVLWLLQYGSIAAKLWLLVLLFDVVAYSAPGLRFKERPVIDSISSSLHFVGPFIYAALLTGQVQAAWPAALAFFLWGMASHAFGAVQDIKADRAAGLRSIATAFGARLTVRLAICLYLLSSLIVLMYGLVALPTALVGGLYALNIWPYRKLTDKQTERANQAWRRFIWLNLLAGAVISITLLAFIRYH